MYYFRLLWWLRGKRICLQCRRLGFKLWVGKIPWRRKRQPTPVFLPGKSHGQRNLAGYSPWGCKRVGHDLATKEHIYVYIHIILAALDLCCWAQAFSRRGNRGSCPVAVRRPLVAVASHCGAWALGRVGSVLAAWVLSCPVHVGSTQPGIKPVPPALAGSFL